MAGPGLSPRYIRTTLVLMMTSLLLGLVSFSTSAWSSSEFSIPSPFGDSLTSHASVGLWRACLDGVCGPVELEYGWLTAVRAFATLGLLASIMASLLFLLYIFVEKTHNDVIYLDVVIASLLQGVFVLLAVCIYASNVPTDLAWSFAFAIMSMVLEFLAAGILIAKKWIIREEGI